MESVVKLPPIKLLYIDLYLFETGCCIKPSVGEGRFWLYGMAVYVPSNDISMGC